jgi:hypothetical protein
MAVKTSSLIPIHIHAQDYSEINSKKDTGISETSIKKSSPKES